MTEDDVRALLLMRAKSFAKNKGSTGITGWCAHHGVAKAHVSEFMSGKRRRPLNDLLDALGLVVTYTHKDDLKKKS